MPKDPTCEERIAAHLVGRMDDMQRFNGEKDAGLADTLYHASTDTNERSNCGICDDCHDDASTGGSALLDEDGDPVEMALSPGLCGACAKDFPDDDGDRVDLALNHYGLSLEKESPEDGEPYICWLLSCGGPSDEFRFYLTGEGQCYRVEYVFKDWFDGASRTLHGADEATLKGLYSAQFADLFHPVEA